MTRELKVIFGTRRHIPSLTAPNETELWNFGLVPEFTVYLLGPVPVRAAIDQAWSRPIRRLWVLTRNYDPPRALGHHERAGFVVYDRPSLRFEDPQARSNPPCDLPNPQLPPLGKS